jgi:autotransporter strand-loop-strand O-heptosyltransferase
MKHLFDCIVGHTSFVALTGYGQHARDFFTGMNRHIPVRVRNFAYVKDLSHMTKEQRDMVIHMTWSEPPYECGTPFNRSAYHRPIDIVLMETNHHWYYQDKEYGSPKVAYNVWESTRQPDHFLEKLLEYDMLWVPTEWQRRVTIEQGYPEDRIMVVPEGVDGEKFRPAPQIAIKQLPRYLLNDKFKFIIFGRWDYRKATAEMMRAFIEEFKPSEPVELLVSIDNPFPVDGLQTTEERLSANGLLDPRIVNIGYVSREDYVRYLQYADVFLSCSRSEGWNLPLIEAIACGTPTIASNYGAQLDFCKDASLLVNIKDMRRPQQVFMQDNTPGYWAEPDFEHLKAVMREAYSNITKYKERSLKMSSSIREKFSWDSAVNKALMILDDFGSGVKKGIVPQKSRAEDVIILDCFPNTSDKEEMVRGQIEKLRKAVNADICLVSHYPASVELQRLVDYYVYDETNPLSENWSLSYWFVVPKFVKLITRYEERYHAAACYSSLKNACRLLKGLYKRAHFVEFDIDADFEAYFDRAKAELQTKLFFGFYYDVERQRKLSLHGIGEVGVVTNLFSFDLAEMADDFVDIRSWDEYVETGKFYASQGEFIYDNIFELWFLRYLHGKKVMECATLLEAEEKKNYILNRNLYDQGDKEPKVRALLSDAIGSKTLLFITNEGPVTANMRLDDRTLVHEEGASPVSVKGGVQDIELPAGQVFYTVYEKEERRIGITIKLGEEYKSLASLRIEPNKSYLETTFKFFDDRLWCESWRDSDNKGFIDPIDDLVITFDDGAKVEILGKSELPYHISFIDRDTKQVVFDHTMTPNHWCKAAPRYYVPWRIAIEKNGKPYHEFDLELKGKAVHIELDSKSLGDTLAWIPYVLEFQKKHGCIAYAATYWNPILEKAYPELRFLDAGGNAHGTFAARYYVGIREGEYTSNKTHWRSIPLAQVASDYLGLEYTEIRPRIYNSIGKRPNHNGKPLGKYVTIAEHSTFRCKYWNYSQGWQTIVDYLNKQGYRVMVVSREPTSLQHIIDRTGSTINQTVNNISHSSFFMGVSSGPLWIAWAAGVPAVCISGFSTEVTEMKDCIRILNKDVCYGCFNDINISFDRGNWNWCPRQKNFECTRAITPKMVIERIQPLLAGSREFK